MLLQLFNLKRLARSERGGYLIIMAAGCVVFIAAAGWAIDSARLYWTKSELQRAADAAALAGARILVRYQSVGYVPGPTGVEERVKGILEENLRISRFTQAEIDEVIGTTSQPGTIQVCFNKDRPDPITNPCNRNPTSPNLQRRFIWVGAQINRKSLILGLLPGFAKFNPVPVSAFAENLALEVVLVLDNTGSMRTKLNPADTKTKMDYLREAASAFVGKLLPFDKVGVVTFDINGPSVSYSGLQKDVNKEPKQDPADPISIFNKIRADYENDSRIFIGLPTDPDPNRWNLQPIEDASGSHIPTIQDMINQRSVDAAHPTIMTPGGSTNLGSGIWRGRDMLDREDGGTVPLNTWRMLIFLTDGSPNTYTPVTWLNVGDRPLDISNPGGCNSLFLSRPVYETNPDGSDGTVKRLREIDAIVEADLARRSNYSVYAVGLGNPDSNRLSPFQSMTSDDMKWALMQRIANDQTEMTKASPAPTPGWTNPAPIPPYLWDFPCVPDGNAIKGEPNGTFWLATSGQSLIDAFAALAEVRTKLSEEPLPN